LACEYDIFISYPRKGHVCEWVHTHLYPWLDGLVAPVLYSNGVRQDLTPIQWKDLRNYNIDVASFRDAVEFPFLVREIQALSTC